MGLFKSNEEKAKISEEKKNKKMQQITKLIQNQLLSDEKVIDFLYGYNDNAALRFYLILTNSRILYREGFSTASIRISDIISTENSLMGIKVIGTNVEYGLKTIIGGNVHEFSRKLNSLK